MLQELDDLQHFVDTWYQRTAAEMQTMHAKFSHQIRLLEDIVTNGGPSSRKPAAMEWESLITPSRATNPRDAGTPSLASPPVNHALDYTTLLEEVSGKKPPHHSSDPEARSRPTPESVCTQDLSSKQPPTDRSQACQVLVEFKRKRILQFESPCYVAPGEYVVVGGDRGEDIGLVTHSWPAGHKAEQPPGGRWVGVGLGKVMRIANVLEVSQLQGVQTELESRAVDVAQEKVVEHQLPMRIVDAEYQFDRKKLTFYYQSQHRLDFRNLVRDLYKTFRARIWMEQDQP